MRHIQLSNQSHYSRRQPSLIGSVVVILCLSLISFSLGRIFRPEEPAHQIVCAKKKLQVDLTSNTQKVALVTHASRFIGLQVSRYLASLDMEVVGIDTIPPPIDELGLGQITENIHFELGSMQNSSHLASVFERYKHIDVLYLMSTPDSEVASYMTPLDSFNTHLMSYLPILNAVASSTVTRVVFVSSTAVYGAVQQPFFEGSATKPTSPYGNAQATLERHITMLASQFDYDYVILRTHDLYGPGMNMSYTAGSFIGSLVQQAYLNKQSVKVPLGEKYTRSFTFIDDIIPIVAYAGVVDGIQSQVLNIGTDKVYTMGEVAEAVMEAITEDGTKNVDRNIDVEFQDIGDQLINRHASHHKVKCLFDLAPSTSLEDGLQKTIKWASKLTFASEMSISTEVSYNAREKVSHYQRAYEQAQDYKASDREEGYLREERDSKQKLSYRVLGQFEKEL